MNSEIHTKSVQAIDLKIRTSALRIQKMLTDSDKKMEHRHINTSICVCERETVCVCMFTYIPRTRRFQKTLSLFI